MNRKRVLVLLIFFLILKIPQFLMLPDFDTGIYATDATMVNQGKKLYVDVWTQKPPGLIVIYASIFLFFGPSLLSLKILGVLYTALTCVALYFLVRFLFDRDTAFYTTLFFVVAAFYLVVSLDGLDSEYFFLMPVLWGSLFFLKGLQRDKYWLIFLSGLCLGVAFFIKQVVFWNILVLVIYVIVLAFRQRRTLYYLKFLMILGVGFLSFQAVWMGYFMVNGHFNDMFENAFLFNLKYIRGSFGLSGYFKQVVLSFGKIVAGISVIWILGAIKLFQNIKQLKQDNILFLTLFFLLNFFGVFTGMRFFGHYFVQVIPAICILAGLYLSIFFKREKKKIPGSETTIRKKRMYMKTALFLAGLIYCLIQGFYLNKYVGENPYYRIKEISQFIKSSTGDGESIYIWGFPPAIYFLSERNCPVRFCFLPIPLPEPDPRVQILSQLTENLPRVVVKSQPASRVPFPGLDELLENHYQLVKEYTVVSINKKSDTSLMRVFMRR